MDNFWWFMILISLIDKLKLERTFEHPRSFNGEDNGL